MKTYKSGRPRVHTSSTIADIKAAVAEYEQFAKDNPEHKLTAELLECAADLREELELRAPAVHKIKAWSENPADETPLCYADKWAPEVWGRRTVYAAAVTCQACKAILSAVQS